MGTNTFNLLIAEGNREGWKAIHSEKKAVKIGEGGFASDKIAYPAWQRGIVALKDLTEIASSHGTSKIEAYATSAIRTASNGRDFIAEVKKVTGINPQLIDGMREATLISMGVRTAFAQMPKSHKGLHQELIKSTNLIVDIGGGSTEYIIEKEGKVLWKQSFQLGVSRLMEQFAPSDPIGDGKWSQIIRHVQRTTIPLQKAIAEFEPDILIGTSGSFDSIVDMLQCEKDRLDKLEKHISLTHRNLLNKIDIKQYERLARTLPRKTSAERAQIPGLIPLRRDLIVLSVILITHALEVSCATDMWQCGYALKEGAIQESFQSV